MKSPVCFDYTEYLKTQNETWLQFSFMLFTGLRLQAAQWDQNQVVSCSRTSSFCHRQRDGKNS